MYNLRMMLLLPQQRARYLKLSRRFADISYWLATYNSNVQTASNHRMHMIQELVYHIHCGHPREKES